MTIVNEDTIDKEFDNNIYQKNLFQPTSYLNAGYGTLYEHHWNCISKCSHTLFNSQYEDAYTQRHSCSTSYHATRVCSFEKNFKLTEWRSQELTDNAVSLMDSFNQMLLEGSQSCIQKYFKYFTQIFLLYFLIKK